MWGTFLSEPLSIVGLVGRYPANCLMERMPIYQRWIFSKYPHAGPLLHAVLVRLSPGYPPLIGKLHTRYSPVRRSPAGIATPAAPRLACVKPVASVHPEPGSNSSLLNCFFIPLLRISLFIVVLDGMFRIILYVSCTTCWYVNLSKNLRFLAIAAAKVRTFSKLPNVSEENLKSFFQVLRRLEFCLASLTSSPTRTTFVHHVDYCRSLSNAGAKVLPYNITSKSFCNYFFIGMQQVCGIRWNAESYGGNFFSTIETAGKSRIPITI